MDVVFIPVVGSETELAQAAILTAVPDYSPESQAIFAKSLDLTRDIRLPRDLRLVQPGAQGSFCGVDMKTRKIRKGSRREVAKWLEETGRTSMEEIRRLVAEIEKRGHQAVVIADQVRELGVIELAEA